MLKFSSFVRFYPFEVLLCTIYNSDKIIFVFKVKFKLLIWGWI